MSKKKPQVETALILRVCNADMSSSHGYVWPQVGEVAECNDWAPVQACGQGLHGWLHGAGDHACASIGKDSKWIVAEVILSEIVRLDGKVKFPRATVRFIGDRHGAGDYIRAHDPCARECAVIGASVIVGDKAHALVGACGTATAGECGTATAGYGGTATAGYGGTATAGNGGTATAGAYGTATAGYGGTATAGNGGTATAGNGGTATAGNDGTATAGNDGTATAGNDGTATAGKRGTATAGERGELRIRWYDDKANRYRTAIAYVGENDIKPNVAYKLDGNRFVAKAEAA